MEKQFSIPVTHNTLAGLNAGEYKHLTTAQLNVVENTSGTNTGDNPGVTSVSGTSPIASSGGDTPAISIPAATNVAAGHATAAHIQAIEANTIKVTNVDHPLVETAVPIGALFTDTLYDHTDFLSPSYTYTTDQTITINDADFIVRDTTDTLTQFIWRDHSAGLLYLGSENATVTLRAGLDANSNKIINADAVGIGTATPSAKSHITTSTATDLLQRIQGAVSQSGDYFNIDSSSGSGGDVFTVQANGYVGIGTVNPLTIFHVVDGNADAMRVESTPTNTTQVDAIDLRSKPLITSDGSYINRGGLYTLRPIIDSGVTNSGRFEGLLMQVLRNYHNGDAGDLASLYGLAINAGHTSSGNSTPTTDEVVGVNVTLNASVGTITDLYGIRIPGIGGSGYTNAYGVYQIDSDMTNYFNGDVGIGVTTPDTKLDVDGAITQRELSADPSDPDEGSSVTWQSDGTGSGDDGDIMMKITAGGSTKTITLVDFSAA